MDNLNYTIKLNRLTLAFIKDHYNNISNMSNDEFMKVYNEVSQNLNSGYKLATEFLKNNVKKPTDE